MNPCPVCASPVHYDPEDVDPFYNQAMFLCRRHPVCRGVVYAGESDDSIMRREHAVSAPRRARTLREQFPQEPWL